MWLCLQHPPYFVYDFCILLINQLSSSDCIYFMRYWANCVLQLFVFQDLTL